MCELIFGKRLAGKLVVVEVALPAEFTAEVAAGREAVVLDSEVIGQRRFALPSASRASRIA